DAEAVPAQPATLDERRPAPEKRIEHPIASLCVTSHQLLRDLRYEVAPVPTEVRAGGVASRHDPQAVGDYFGILLPPVQIYVVDRRGLLAGKALLETLHVVSRALDSPRRENLIQLFEQDRLDHLQAVPVLRDGAGWRAPV